MIIYDLLVMLLVVSMVFVTAVLFIAFMMWRKRLKK